ncbi:MAG: hypothetical protein ABIE42_08455 [Candidatus Eisenbacteria bacterium]
MLTKRTCKYCGHDFHVSELRCPHCERPCLYPNVEVADSKDEREALETRYQDALLRAKSRGAEDKVKRFETLVESDSVAVIAMSFEQFEFIAKSDRDAKPNYYKLQGAGLRQADESKWGRYRDISESATFPYGKEDISFAALSLGGVGVASYGNCFVTLRDEFIAHRTSVFHENNVLWMLRLTVKEAADPPHGFRAPWGLRKRLAVAKHADQIEAGSHEDRFPDVMVVQGKIPEDDVFVEVHVWGRITIRSVQAVHIRRFKNRPQMSRIKDLRAYLDRFDVSLEVG